MKNKLNDKNILDETLLDFKIIEEMMAKTSDSTITSILNEKVKENLKKIITEDEDEEDVDSVNSDSTETEEDGLNDVDGQESGISDDENEPINADDLDGDGDVDLSDAEDGEGSDSAELADNDEEDFDMSKFQTGDDEYDLTGADIDSVVRVFKKVDDNDSIIVKKTDDGKIELIDNEADTEYLIDLDGVEGESDEDGLVINDEEIDSENDELDEEVEIDLDDEDLMDEKNMTQSISANRRSGVMSQTRQEYAPGANNRDGSKLIASESAIKKAYEKKLNLIESKYAEKIKQLDEEMKQYKETLIKFRDKLKESAVLNNNLAKYVKLVTENATTKDEKLQILNRFATEANTIEAGNSLFESINKSLNKKTVSGIDINVEKQFAVNNPPKKLDEQVIYQDKSLQETINLMKRMNNL